MTKAYIIRFALLVVHAMSLCSQTPTQMGHRISAAKAREKAIRNQALGLLKAGLASKVRHTSKATPDFHAIAADLYKRHRIIGLGEVTHGTSEIQTMRADLLKALVHEGARAIVLEMPVTKAFILDDYVCHRTPGNPAILAVMKQARFYKVWRVQEVAAMFEWIREFNAKHAEDPVRIYGMDHQMGDLERSLQLLEKSASSFDASAMRVREASYVEATGALFEAIDPDIKAVPSVDSHRVYESRTKDILDVRVAIAASSLSQNEMAEAERHLRAAEQNCINDKRLTLNLARLFSTFNEVYRFESEGIARDQFMAENVLLLDKLVLHGKGKVILWAHSLHLSRLPMAVPYTKSNFIPVGNYIAQHYGDQYHVMNFTTGEGTVRAWNTETPGPTDRLQPVAFRAHDQSIEGLMRSAGARSVVFFETKDLPMVDLKVQFLGIGEIYVDKDSMGLYEGSCANFDSIVYIPVSRASTELLEPGRP